MIPDYLEKYYLEIPNCIEKSKQNGIEDFSGYFQKKNAYENYLNVNKDLEIYLYGLFEGIVLERGLTDDFNDIMVGLNNSNKFCRVAEDLSKPNREHFRNIGLIEDNFRLLLADTRMFHISGREYIEKWQMYNQLFAVKGDKK